MKSIKMAWAILGLKRRVASLFIVVFGVLSIVGEAASSYSLTYCIKFSKKLCGKLGSLSENRGSAYAEWATNGGWSSATPSYRRACLEIGSQSAPLHSTPACLAGSGPRPGCLTLLESAPVSHADASPGSAFRRRAETIFHHSHRYPVTGSRRSP
jgi:hypothetical protein